MDGVVLTGERRDGPASLWLTQSIVVAPHLREQIREVVSFYCEPEYRRQGHGAALLGKVCLEADQARRVLLLHVNPTEDIPVEALEALYARFGFVRLQDEPLLMVRNFNFKLH